MGDYLYGAIDRLLTPKSLHPSLSHPSLQYVVAYLQYVVAYAFSGVFLFSCFSLPSAYNKMRISSIEDINEEILPRTRAVAPTRRKGSARARRAGGASVIPLGRAPAREPRQWRLTRDASRPTLER